MVPPASAQEHNCGFGGKHFRRYGKGKGKTKQASFVQKLQKTCPIGKSMRRGLA
jgi:hypothetical protein